MIKSGVAMGPIAARTAFFRVLKSTHIEENPQNYMQKINNWIAVIHIKKTSFLQGKASIGMVSVLENNEAANALSFDLMWEAHHCSLRHGSTRDQS